MSDSEQTVVLVADDEPSTLALVTAHVRAKGYKVIEASDGDMAWTLAYQHLPHLVILDVMMPGMSGWEVCRKIRESLPLAHTGVIMLTGIGENLNEMTSPLYGADAHVDKPFEFSELDEKIQETLALRREGKFGRTDDADVEGKQDDADDIAGIPSLMPPAEDEDVDFSADEDDDEMPPDSLPPPPPARASRPKAPKPVAAKTAKPVGKKSVKQAKKAVAPVAKSAKAAKLAKPAAGKKASKKAAAKKAVAKKAVAKQATKKTAAKKTAVKKAAAKKPAAKKTAAKKTVAKATVKKVTKKVASKPVKSAKAAKKAGKKAGKR